MSSKRFFGEYMEVDPANGADVDFARQCLRQRMQARKTHERARCPSVRVESETIEMRQEECQWRLVSDLVLSYPDPERVPVEAR
jgi:hypothetical protein